MLKELKNTSQHPGQAFRRWFADNMLDLIVWYNPDSSIKGFQFCYPQDVDRHAVTWLKDKSFSHDKIDEGESGLHPHKMSPILSLDPALRNDNALALFKEVSKGLDADIVTTVVEVFNEYGRRKKMDNKAIDRTS